MIGYVLLGTNDLEKSAKFYDELFSEVGIQRGMQMDNMISWGAGPAAPSFGIIRPFDGKAASVGNGTMVGLPLQSPEQVDALHAKALALGGSDEGAAGPRGDGGFYAGYFRDLDGNKLNFFCIVQK
jgi:predicted lactoylglutathione lyase